MKQMFKIHPEHAHELARGHNQKPSPLQTEYRELCKEMRERQNLMENLSILFFLNGFIWLVYVCFISQLSALNSAKRVTCRPHIKPCCLFDHCISNILLLISLPQPVSIFFSLPAALCPLSVSLSLFLTPFVTPCTR